MATQAFLAKAYLAYFGRPVDPSGQLTYANSTEAEVMSAFSSSAESVALYGATFGYTQINAIYNMLFGRDADLAGATFYVARVASGLSTSASVAVDILNGAQNSDVTVVDNKLLASAAFTASLDTISEVVAYSGNTAAAAARTYLQTVTSTAATQAEVDAAVVTTVSASTTATTASSTFTLTADDAGSKTGGTGDDSFIALDDSLQNYVVDGGDGTDSLRATISATESYDVSNVETLTFKTTADATIDMDDFSGETSITVRGSAADVTTTLTNVEAGTALTSEFTSTAALTASLDDASGSDDSLTLTLDDASSTGTTTLDDIETINIVASGSDNSLTLDADSVVTLNITGDADLTVVLTTAADLETIDASAATGDLTFSVVVANDIALTTGSGDDAVTFADASLDDGDTVDLGEGTNTLTLIATDDIIYLTSAEDGDIAVSNVQTLSLVADGLDAIDFDVFSDPTAFTTVLVTSTLDAATITLTDIQQTAISIRNTDSDDESTTIAAVTYDKKDYSDDADDLSIALTNRDDDENFTITALTAAGIENITIAAGYSGDDEDITITTLTATSLEALTITGAANLTITGALADTVETVDGSAATGDLDITVGTSDMTITGGDGDDTFTFGATLDTDDTIDGGDGDDTVEVTFGAALFDDDVAVTNVEALDMTQAAGAFAVTMDLRNADSLETFTVTFENTQDTVTTLERVSSTLATVEIDAITGDSTDTLVIELNSDGTADEIAIEITNATASFDGTLTLNDYETISIDVTGAGQATLLADVNASDATTITFTNDDAYAATDDLIVTAALDGDDAVVDLSGWEQDIGTQGGAVDLSDGAGGENTVVAIAAQVVALTSVLLLAEFVAGITLTAASDYTVMLTDGRTSTELTVINLGLTSGQSGIDTIEFVNTTADATDDIGDVVIEAGFTARDATTGSVSNYTVIDFSAFTDVESVGDLIITAAPDADGADNTLITSAEFAGTILLVGVTLSELTTDNFIFA
jgi:hypothetical protein